MAVTPFAPQESFNSQTFNQRISEMNTDTDNLGNLITENTTSLGTLSDTIKTKVSQFGPVTVSVPVGSWAGSGPWTQTVTVAGVLATDTGLNIYPVDIADANSRKAYNTAYGCLAVEAQTVDGGITLTCRDAKPTITFDIIVKGVR